MNRKLFLINVSGQDKPGITSSLMEIVSKYNAEIMDMGQAVTYGLLSLSFLLKFKFDSSDNDNDNSKREEECIKDLLFVANNKDQQLTYKVVKQSTHVTPDQDQKFVLNCVTPNQIPSEFLSDAAKVLSENKINILRIDNVTPQSFNCLEIVTTIPSEVDFIKVKHDLLNISTKHAIDIAFLKDNVFRRSKRLICFDMDSTLIQTEVIDEMAESCGVGPEIKAITEEAMNGQIDFDQSLIKRVSKLKGLTISEMDEIYKNLKLTQGCEDFIKTVKSLGYKVALISGGFNFFAEKLKDRLGLDYAFANDLEIIDGKLTGKVQGTIVNASQKSTLLKLIAQQEKITLDQTVAIGDGANDLPMLDTAGLGIAYHAKDIVKEKAQQHLSYGPMTSILYFLGIPGTQIKK